MRRLFVCLFILLATASSHSQKTRYGQELPFPKKGVDYSLPIHVSGIRVGSDCENGYCVRNALLDVLVDGKKLQLSCPLEIPEGPDHPMPMALGDTHGRIMPKSSGGALGDNYEILSPHGRVIGCVVSGIFE
jgi:hypothetical protein